MSTFLRHTPTAVRVAPLLCLVIFTVACGPAGPPPPAPGTPEFNWLRAQEAFKAGDYDKANDLLVEVAESQSELAAKAQPWALVSSLGLATAYMELADKLNQGADRNRKDPAAFRRIANEYKVKARNTALQYARVAHRFVTANKDKEVTLSFEPPEAAFEDPVQYKKLTVGQMIPEGEIAAMERQVLRRELLRAACRAVNLPKDPAKGRAAYQGGETKVAGPTFLLLVANGLYEVGEMFGPKKLDQPHRLKGVYDTAEAALELIKGNKDAKELLRKVTEARKKLKV